jgi:thioredoxin 1
MRKLNSVAEFDAGIASGVVLVDFYADWCGPCKITGPILDEVSKKYEGKVEFLKVSVDEHQDLAASFSVMSIPTVIIFKDGKPVADFVGVRSKDAVAKIIDEVI